MDYKITEIVDEKALHEVQELTKELQNLKNEYVEVTKSLGQKINLNVSSLTAFKEESKSIADVMQRLERIEKEMANTSAQVKSATDKVADSIRKETTSVKEQVSVKTSSLKADQSALEIATRIVGTRQQNTRLMAQYTKALKDNSAIQSELNKKENAGLISAKAATEQRAKLISEERELKAAKQELNSVLSIEEKMANSAEGSYVNLSQSLELMKKAFKEMTEQEKKSLDGTKLSKAISETDEEIKKMAADMGEYQRNVGNYGKTTESIKGQLKNLIQEIAQLTVQYRAMSDAEKQSAEGKALEEKIKNTTKEAALLKDAVSDVNRAISSGASDTSTFNAISEGVQLLIDGFGAAEGAATLLGMSEGELAEIQTKLQAAFVASNALMKIQNTLQKESNLMKGVATVQEGAYSAAIAIRTAAEGKGVIATKAAVIAQAAFNAVANANPYVLLATAIVSVVGAVAAFTLGSQRAKKEQEKVNKELEQTNKNLENIKKKSNFDIEIAKAAGASSEKIRQMRVEAAKLNLEMARLSMHKGFDLYIRGKIDENQWKDIQQRVIDMQNELKEVNEQNQIEITAEQTQAEKERLQLQKDAIQRAKAAHEKALQDKLQREKEYKEYLENIDKQLAQSKIDILADGQEKEEKQIMANYKTKLDTITGETEAEKELRKNLYEQMQNELAEVRQKYLEKAEEDEREASEQKLSKIQKYMENEVDIINGAMVKKLTELNEKYSSGLIDRESYEKEYTDITDKYSRQASESAIKYLEEVLTHDNITTEERIVLAKKLAELKLKLSDEIVNATKREEEAAEDAAKKEEEILKRKLQSIEKYTKASADVVDSFAAFGDQLYQNQIDKIQQMVDSISSDYESELAKIEELERNGSIATEEAEARKRAAKDKTMQEEEKLAKRKAEIEKKQANMAKANAIAQTIINTALGIMKTIAQVGFPLAIPFVALTSAQGAAQLATILSTPVAAYKKGTNDHPGGLAIVGDGGKKELVTFGGKSWITPDTPTLVNLPQHAKVHPDASKPAFGEELNEFLKPQELTRMLVSDINRNRDTVNININNNELVKEIKALNNTFDNALKKIHRDLRDAEFNAHLDFLMK